MEKAYKRIPPQNLPTNPVLVPILGRVVLDSLRRQSPLDLLLQNKLKHPMMLSLGLIFSPFPAGDLVSKESQKTRKFGVEEEHFKELGLPLNPTVEIDFRELRGSYGNLNPKMGRAR